MIDDGCRCTWCHGSGVEPPPPGYLILYAILDAFDVARWTVAELFAYADAVPDSYLAAILRPHQGNRTRLGKLLKSLEGRRIDDMTLCRDGTERGKKMVLWRIDAPMPG